MRRSKTGCCGIPNLRELVLCMSTFLEEFVVPERKSLSNFPTFCVLWGASNPSFCHVSKFGHTLLLASHRPLGFTNLNLRPGPIVIRQPRACPVIRAVEMIANIIVCFQD